MNELHATPPFDALWRGIDPYDWLDELEGEAYRDVDSRRTIRFEVDGASYFAKIHESTPRRERIKNWLSLRPPILDATSEVRAIERLKLCGVAVPEIVAWGVRGKAASARRSFVITRDVGTQHTLSDACIAGLSPSERRIAIRELALAIRTMHAAGVNHRDCYLVHVLVRHLSSEGADLVLLDFHRAQVRESVPRRWIAKDLGGLWFSAEVAGLSRTSLFRFVRCYTGMPPADALRTQRVLWSEVAARRRGLIRERKRRGDRFGR